MSEITEPCEFCNADSERAFIKYHADANDAQTETDWYDGTPETVYAVVCITCGEPLAFVDPRNEADLPDFNDLPHGTGGRDYRVDNLLE